MGISFKKSTVFWLLVWTHASPLGIRFVFGTGSVDGWKYVLEFALR
jgi:hypothetical protein